MRPPEKFTLVLEAERWSTPAVTRLKRALKLLLRSFGLKCLDCREVKPDAGPQPPLWAVLPEEPPSDADHG